MALIDWIIFATTLLGAVLYGLYKSKISKTEEGYVLGDRSQPGYLVLISIMATQASAITFLSAPGQAYTEGLRFVQSYFGQPLAMLVIAFFFISVYQKLNVFSAYEFIEKRFDKKTRLLTASLFLASRGLSTGISIYAPSLIFSILLNINIYLAMLIVGGLLAIYTVVGGAKSISHTMKFQFISIMFCLIIVFIWLKVKFFTDNSWDDLLKLAGKENKINPFTTGFENGKFNWNDKFNIWSGIIGGFFLSLSYFGTDQSQVGRYITAKNTNDSKFGLLWNGILKIPMQFFLLMLGILVFLFYQKNNGPIYFNEKLKIEAHQTKFAPILDSLERSYKQNRDPNTRSTYIQTIKKSLPDNDAKDTDYIFLYFLRENVIPGLKGFLLALILLASWGSIAAAIHALATSTFYDFDFQKNKKGNIFKKLQILTVIWCLLSLAIAYFADVLGNSLIESVNIIGSWFYGVILAIFLVGLFLKNINSNTIFTAALISQAAVIVIYFQKMVSYLWLNVIGVLLVLLLSLFLQKIQNK